MRIVLDDLSPQHPVHVVLRVTPAGRGLRTRAISAAKRLNRALGRKRGTVCAYRYHATAITNPTQARNAISYVLNNWRHHGEDVGRPWRVGPWSSAWRFFGIGTPREPLPVLEPTTWLLDKGWNRAGSIVPGPDPDEPPPRTTLPRNWQRPHPPRVA